MPHHKRHPFKRNSREFVVLFHEPSPEIVDKRALPTTVAVHKLMYHVLLKMLKHLLFDVAVYIELECGGSVACVGPATCGWCSCITSARFSIIKGAELYLEAPTGEPEKWTMPLNKPQNTPLNPLPRVLVCAAHRATRKYRTPK